MHITNPWLTDDEGRTLILRGINLAGSSKVPARPRTATRRQFLQDHRKVSFVGRPFPLEAAREHFARIRSWGFTLLRLLVPWEAVEHAGPGQYDQEYLAYLDTLVGLAGDHDLQVLIDPHQDTWSRLCGGSGAPGWTLEAVGFDLATLQSSGAAMIHPLGDGPAFKRWPTNYTRLASATMFSLFFGGDDFAPLTRIGNESVQQLLQGSYIAAFTEVAHCLRNHTNLVGFDTLNEPSPGYIGWVDLAATDGVHYLRDGPAPTPLQAMALGEGIPQKVELWRIGLFGPAQKGTVWVNRGQVRAWQSEAGCVWRANGVWEQGPDGAPRLLRPHHFTEVAGRAVDFGRDYLRPFINRYAASISAVAPRSIFFIETTPGFSPPQWGPEDAQPIVNAQHWYDMFTLMTKVFLPFFNVNIATGKPVFGVRAVDRMFAQQQQAILADSAQRLAGAPTILGEFGTPFNMPLRINLRFNWFGLQTLALNTYYRAIERNLLSAIIWNYTPDNSYCFGDGWNGEDLSLFSADQPHGNGQHPDTERGVPAVVRPYAMRIAGVPTDMEFDLQRKRFRLTFRHDPAVSAPTELFVPLLHYPNGCAVSVSDGTYDLNLPAQRLRYVHSNERNEHTIIITPN
jgi:hypothetical protein